jgi:hypothetical protein
MSESGHYFRLKGESAERIVHELAEKSFFTDWCYRNPALPDGNELCDLLVVFDDVAIIWQIKDLKLQENGRYNPKAVEKNLRQLSGAYRRLMDERRPITLCNPRRGDEVFDPRVVNRVFLISVLTGEGEDFHSAIEKVRDRSAHVFDGEFLEIALGELDTIQDFIAYLEAKEEFLNGRQLIVNGGEQELLAIYLMNNRSFERFADATMVVVEEGSWHDLQQRPEYIAKKKADEISYGWDQMIDRAHESAVPEYERVARRLARPNRFTRRCLAKAFYDAHVLANEDKVYDVFRRVMAKDGVTYCFLFMEDPEPRGRRQAALAALCFMARGKFQENLVVIGIATEKVLRPQCSYDFCYFEMPEWTSEAEAQAEEIRRNTGLLTNTTMRAHHEDEYP